MLKDPTLGRAQFAVEVTAVFTVELDVSKIEFRTFALCSFAISRLDTTLNQFFGRRVSSQVKRSVNARVLYGQIHSVTHETLEDSQLRVSCSLMNAVVSVNVHQKRVHFHLHK